MLPSGYFVSPHLALGAIWVWDPGIKLNKPTWLITISSRCFAALPAKRASERNYYWSGNFVKNVPPLKRIVPELQYCWKCSLLHNVFERQINQNRTKLKALHSLQHCNRIRLHCWNSSSCSWKLFNFRSESCELTGLKAYTSSTVFCL